MLTFCKECSENTYIIQQCVVREYLPHPSKTFYYTFIESVCRNVKTEDRIMNALHSDWSIKESFVFNSDKNTWNIK